MSVDGVMETPNRMSRFFDDPDMFDMLICTLLHQAPPTKCEWTSSSPLCACLRLRLVSKLLAYGGETEFYRRIVLQVFGPNLPVNIAALNKMRVMNGWRALSWSETLADLMEAHPSPLTGKRWCPPPSWACVFGHCCYRMQFQSRTVQSNLFKTSTNAEMLFLYAEFDRECFGCSNMISSVMTIVDALPLTPRMNASNLFKVVDSPANPFVLVDDWKPNLQKALAQGIHPKSTLEFDSAMWDVCTKRGCASVMNKNLFQVFKLAVFAPVRDRAWVLRQCIHHGYVAEPSAIHSFLEVSNYTGFFLWP